MKKATLLGVLAATFYVGVLVGSYRVLQAVSVEEFRELKYRVEQREREAKR